MTSIGAQHITAAVRSRQIITDVTLAAPAGTILSLIGPNGSGKSTLLRIMAGLRPPHEGTVLLGDSLLSTLRRRQVAQRMAVVEQESEAHTELTVEQVVALGRTPYRGRFDPLSARDIDAIETALVRTGLTDRRNQRWHTLSGGERQRAQLARALAQEPSVILLDEPTNHLDIAHQLEILELLRTLNITVVTALHDLNLAARYSDHIAVLDNGRIHTHGTPTDVLTAQLIAKVYRVHAIVETSPHTGRPAITYLGSTLRHDAVDDAS